MRSSFSAQSCDSVPPAPGWIDTIALSASCSPPSIFLISPASTCCCRASRPAARSSATLSPSLAHSNSTSRSSLRVRSDSARSTSSWRRRRRWRTLCAAAWSSQNPDAAACSSRRAISDAAPAASKIAPQIGRPLDQLLVPPCLLLERHRHAVLRFHRSRSIRSCPAARSSSGAASDSVSLHRRRQAHNSSAVTATPAYAGASPMRPYTVSSSCNRTSPTTTADSNNAVRDRARP